MATAAPTTDAPVAYMLPGVNLFASGVYRDVPWTAMAIRKIAANARRLGPDGKRLLTPPVIGEEDHRIPKVVIGHEEDADQQYLQRTDLPAAGWVDPRTVTAVADADNPGHLILRGDIVNIPPQVADRIEKGEYAYGSAELYRDFADDFGNKWGPVLRRFAILGGDVAQVKRLGQLPRPVPMTEIRRFAEMPGDGGKGKGERRDRTFILTFAERIVPGTVPDRQTMNAAITQGLPGISQSFVDSLSDDAAAELTKSIPQPAAPAAPVAGAVPGQQPPAGAATPMADPAAAGMAPTDPTMGGMSAGQPAAAAVPPADPTQQSSMADPDPSATADPTTTDPTAPDPAPSDPATDPSMMPREVLIANLVRAGQDEQTLTAMGDDDLKSLYAAVMGGGSGGDADGDGVADQLDPAPADPDVTQNADDSADPTCAPGNPAGDDDPNKKVGGGSATAPAAAGSSSYSEHANVSTTATKPQPAVKPAPAVPTKTVAIPAGEYESFREQATYVTAAAAAVKKTRIETFCEGLIRSGRYTPAEVDALVKPSLANLNDTKAVHQFNEGGKTVSKTALGKKMAELEAMRKPNQGVRIGERFNEGGGGSLNGDAGKPDMAPVQRFAEVNAAMLKRTGYKTPKQFVDKMSEVAEKDPEGFARYVADLPAEYKN